MFFLLDAPFNLIARITSAIYFGVFTNDSYKYSFIVLKTHTARQKLWILIDALLTKSKNTRLPEKTGQQMSLNLLFKYTNKLCLVTYGP